MTGASSSQPTRLDLVWDEAASTASSPASSPSSGPALERVESLVVVCEHGASAARMAHEVAALCASLPALRSADVLLRDAPATDVAWREFTGAFASRGVALRLGFVLGDDADAFAALAGRDTSLSRVLDETRSLVGAGARVAWWIPLSPALVFRLEALSSLARDEGVEPELVPLDATPTARPSDARALSSDERLFAWDFLTYRTLEEEREGLSPEQLQYALRLRAALAEPAEPMPTAAATVLRASPGGWASTDVHGVDLRGALTHARAHGADAKRHSAQPSHLADVAGVLRDGCRALSSWAVARAFGRAAGDPAERGERDARLARVLLIGAYGGEHIGDAAILGGVLHRVHARYGTTRGILMSQRPVHSRHLVAMLDTPVALEVDEYEHARVDAALERVDAVVYAGGPLIDLPKQLVRHLYAASRARRRGLPFLIEGIGVGPFVRRPSEWFGRRILGLADRITVRTSEDGARSQVADLAREVGRDPAFDYLASRPADAAELTRLPDAERRRIDELLAGTESRPVVGINLRPIGHLYTVGAGDHDLLEYTRTVEARFEQALADGLRRFRDEADRAPCFVFYSMNSIQFGHSDMRSAYRIARLLGGDVDLRVWEADASLDGVVALLRRIDVAVTMRFHATIFALSQALPVVGVDYRIGKRDKVAMLLDDFGRSEDCERIDTLTAEWLSGRLRSLWNGSTRRTARTEDGAR